MSDVLRNMVEMKIEPKDAAFLKLIDRMVQIDARERISSSEALGDPLFSCFPRTHKKASVQKEYLKKVSEIEAIQSIEEFVKKFDHD